MRTVNKKQQGFSMIEVLVSLIVIGVGMLGLSGLQIASMKGTNNAHSRNVASMLIMDLSDRMRANPEGVRNGFYNNNVSCSSNETRCRINTYCTTQETARFDVQEVMCGVIRAGVREGGAANLLPNGSVQISCAANCSVLNTPHNITFSWNAAKIKDDQQDADQNQSIIVSIIP